MILREPAGWERREGKSAELLVRARTWGGSVGNTHGTVCGFLPQGRYPLTGFSAHFVFRTCEVAVGRGVSLPTFYLGFVPGKRKVWRTLQ